MVLSASGAELERDFPFGAVRQLFAREAGARAAVHGRRGARARGARPGARARRRLDAEYATLHGLYWLVVALAERAPLLLCIDDVHWVDAPSLRFLGFLARRLDGLRVLVCGALRPAEPGTDRTLLSELALGAELIEPAPLTPRGRRAADRRRARTGVRRLLPRPDGRQPVLPAGAARRGCVTRHPGDAGGRRTAALARPEGLARRLLHRLEALGPGAPSSRARSRCSATGRRSRRPAGSPVSSRPRRPKPRPRSSARRSRGGGERLAFVHPVVRGTVYSAIGSALRGEQHARAARLLDDERADLDRVAAQLLLTRRRRNRGRWSGCAPRPPGRWPAAPPRTPPRTCAGRSTRRRMPSCARRCCASWPRPRPCCRTPPRSSTWNRREP